jgi:hypothetical protein
MKTFIAFFALTLTAYAAPIELTDYSMALADIAESGISKEKLFSEMDSDFIKVGSSICSNRAQMWIYEMKKKHQIDAGKLFLFYTSKTGKVGRKTWWYHVTPIVNENSKIWALDAGFTGNIDSPLSKEKWMESFIGTSNCKEIKSGESELIEWMFRGRVFPETTEYGTYDCYYKITPASYWTPNQVAMNLLGQDSAGTPVRFERAAISESDTYLACIEATTSKIGGFLGLGKKKCKKYLNRL